MILEELEEIEFRKFLDQHPLKTFMQTPEIGNLRQENGWSVCYLGMKEKGKIVAATMLLSKKRYLGKVEYYALRGPLLDYENQSLCQTFLKALIGYTKQHHGYMLRMDPYLVYQERNSAGEIVQNGIHHKSVVKQMLGLGFHKVAKKEEEQVSFMYVLDIAGKTEDDILKNMKPNTRNTIRKTLKNGIEIKELARDELGEFYKIMVETGKRKGFAVRDLSYFTKMYELFHERNEIKYLITKLNLTKHIKLLESEREEKVVAKDKLNEAKYNDGKRKAFENEIASFDRRIEKAKELKREKGEEIVLSGSMFLLTQPEVVYLSSGNYEEYLMFNSQYLIQWEMIKYAIQHGYRRYNFYGIPDSFDKSDKDYGIYEFKTGFNGYVEQLLGEYVKPLSLLFYVTEFIHKRKNK